jgi:hypothetical protein
MDLISVPFSNKYTAEELKRDHKLFMAVVGFGCPKSIDFY